MQLEHFTQVPYLGILGLSPKFKGHQVHKHHNYEISLFNICYNNHCNDDDDDDDYSECYGDGGGVERIIVKEAKFSTAFYELLCDNCEKNININKKIQIKILFIQINLYYNNTAFNCYYYYYYYFIINNNYNINNNYKYNYIKLSILQKCNEKENKKRYNMFKCCRRKKQLCKTKNHHDNDINKKLSTSEIERIKNNKKNIKKNYHFTAWSGVSKDKKKTIDNNKKIGRRIILLHRGQKFLNYSLFLLLYLLALPILCSTDPSSSSSSSTTFNKLSSSLIKSANLTVQNVSKKTSDEFKHPYNEYSWEVNQLNPWLSACDLAGPAPADLQGSCGPPEVPKYCPNSCPNETDANGIFNLVLQQIDIPLKWLTGSAINIQKSNSIKPKNNNKYSNNNKNNNNYKSSSNKDSGRMSTSGTLSDQCLFYLAESHKRDICNENFGKTSLFSFLTVEENRFWFIRGLRLRHCCEHAVINALAPGKGGPLEHVFNGGDKCIQALDKLLSVDALAARLHCEFEEVLARYDCAQSYSIIHNCTHCKEAYRKWVCSSLVPYFVHEGPSDLKKPRPIIDTRLRPCRSFCQSVEQRCPYLLPGDRAPAYPTQYAGEPTFLCRDPNIPETGKQEERALHGNEEEECCFYVCSEDQPGLGICANCTDKPGRGLKFNDDYPTAPHCDIPNIPGQSVTSVQDKIIDNNGESSIITTTKVSSYCGTGGVGLITSPSTSSSSISLNKLSSSLVTLSIGLITINTGPTILFHSFNQTISLIFFTISITIQLLFHFFKLFTSNDHFNHMKLDDFHCWLYLTKLINCCNSFFKLTMLNITIAIYNWYFKIR